MLYFIDYQGMRDVYVTEEIEDWLTPEGLDRLTLRSPDPVPPFGVIPDTGRAVLEVTTAGGVGTTYVTTSWYLDGEMVRSEETTVVDQDLIDWDEDEHEVTFFEVGDE